MVAIASKVVKLGFTFPSEPSVVREELVESIKLNGVRQEGGRIRAFGRIARLAKQRSEPPDGNVMVQPPRVGLIMGSQSDWSTLRHAATILDELAIIHEDRIVSAHRTPKRLVEYATTARERGLHVIIAGPAAPRTCPAWSPL